MTTRHLQRRLPLTREAPGSYRTDDGSVQVLQLSEQRWIVRANGQPIKVAGRGEFQSLTECQGLLADVRDLLRERRPVREAG